VGNNPVNHIDPTGHCIEDLCIGEAIVVATLAEEYGPELVAEGEELALAAEEALAPVIEELGEEASAAADEVMAAI
jgi:hypothetical protein